MAFWKDLIWPERCHSCGQRIPTKADGKTPQEGHNCPACGATLVCTNLKDGTLCNNVLRAGAKFCGKCALPVAKPSAIDKKRGITALSASEDMVAKRIRVGEVSDWLRNMNGVIQVDQGFAALAIANGKVLGTLGPGQHSLDPWTVLLRGIDSRLGRDVLLYRTTPTRFRVGVDAGGSRERLQVSSDIRTVGEGFAAAERRVTAPRPGEPLPTERLHVDASASLGGTSVRTDAVVQPTGMFTAEGLRLGVVVRLGVLVGDALVLMVQALRGRDEITTKDLIALVEEDVRIALEPIVLKSSAAEIYANAALRAEMTGAIQRAVHERLDTFGLELAETLAVEFKNERIDALRDQEGDLYVLSRESGVRLRRRGLEVEEKIAGRAQDETWRDREHASLLEASRRRVEAAAAVAQARLAERPDEILEEEHEAAKEVARARGGDDYSRDKTTRDAEAKREVSRKDQELAVDMLRKMKTARLEEMQGLQNLEKERLSTLATADAKALLAVLPKDQAGKVIELERMRASAGLSPDQMLVFLAANSPELAGALAKKYEKEGQVAGDRVALMERMLGEMKSLQATSIEAMAKVAGAAAAGRAAVCPNTLCGRAITPGSKFCPHCGHNLIPT